MRHVLVLILYLLASLAGPLAHAGPLAPTPACQSGEPAPENPEDEAEPDCD